MIKRERGSVAGFSMSFLDVICCGFGAIILLLMITKIVEPQVLEDAKRSLAALVAELREELFATRGDDRAVQQAVQTHLTEIEKRRAELQLLEEQLDNILGRYELTVEKSRELGATLSNLRSARQKLTEEMKRLQASSAVRPSQDIIGVPVDSEYIIFIIDTSGSMQGTWKLVQEKLAEILAIYPKVRGIQVLNDMGDYMFNNYKGRWIPDSPGRRTVILGRLRTWNAYSNSSPVEGIQHAIRTFHDDDKTISLYVFGDEFTGPSIENVIDAVNLINTADADGNRRVRIHAVGFPVQFGWGDSPHVTGIRFATLMRELTYRNNGTFVGLPEFY